MNTPSCPPLAAIWSTDQHGICSLHHHAPTGVLADPAGQSLPAWIARHAGAAAAQQTAQALQPGVPFQIDLALAGLDGATRQVVLSGLPHHGPDGTDLQYAGFIADVTALHDARQHAERNAEEYRLLVENSTDLIARCGADGNYISLSPSYGRMMGWTTENVVGQPVVDFLHPDDRAHATQALAAIFNGVDLADAVEVRKRHRDGHYVAIGTRARGIHDPATGQCVGAVMVSRDITRDKDMLRQLEEKAARDPLTGLPNRAWINEHVDSLLGGAHSARCTAILFIDLNGFKAVNDTMGHAAGDALLQQVGARLTQCMRPGDAVARLGGDEFVVAADCCDAATAAAIAQRLLDALQAPFDIDDTPVRIGAAIGISLADGGTASTSSLFQHADTAMYAAKGQLHGGGGSYRIFGADADELPATAPDAGPPPGR